jgi:general secretion pathway protein J
MNVAKGQRGFTLVEMLVALFIFSVLAGAGVTLLRASVDTQEAVNGALADLGAAARLRMLIRSDVAQVVARPVAGAPTGLAGSGASLTLVRAVEPADVRPGETGLQVVRWSLEESRLVRTVLASDGRSLGPGAVLAREVASLGFRYRAASGEWSDNWTGTPAQDALPTVIEVRLARTGEAPVRLVAALPQGASPGPVPTS